MAKTFALSTVGCDEPGIIAAITKVLLDLDCNLADTNMSVLNGRFAMVLMLQSGDGLSAERIQRSLEQVARRFRLLLSVQELQQDELPRYFAPAPRDNGAMVTVYGADRPGIVHGVTEAVAALGGNVTDLRTQKVDGPRALYTLFLEVALPAGQSRESLAAMLGEYSRRLDVQVQVQNVGTADL